MTLENENPKHLIVFTRYPIPGATKTRLIPVLGAKGAADLQRRMTEHTLQQIKPVSLSGELTIEVRYEGGDEKRMQNWLGADFSYRTQGNGDIGVRMKRAFEAAFTSGAKAAVLIGTDIPGINPLVIGKAFEKLRRDRLVLGPAKDGGYYLIGLRRESMPRALRVLFSGIDWGGEGVLARTLEKARRIGLRYNLLDLLKDIDRPEDLPLWKPRCARVGHAPSHPKISVVIPALNEEHHIVKTIESIGRGINTEVIVVDGGSDDATVPLARSQGVRVINGTPPRSRQMNRGAGEAVGDMLIFLHADTLLPEHFEESVIEVLRRPGAVAGAFELGIDSRIFSIRFIERLANWRSRRMGMPYGDQAIFLTSETFRRVGGFPELPIMEDFELIRLLKKRGDIVIVPKSVLTSPRRWTNYGVIRTTLTNQLVLLAYFLGLSSERISRWYHREQGVGH
jgi:rSAM/selenodomain-associated transferase 2/rSAM/selenodomain-associated transferase 1